MPMCSGLILDARDTAAPDGHMWRWRGLSQLRQLSPRYAKAGTEGPGNGRNGSMDITAEIQGSMSRYGTPQELVKH